MKIQKLISICMPLAIGLSCGVGLAHEGGTTGVGGGGLVITVDGKQVPVEIAEIRFCEWKTGAEYASTIPYFSQLLESTRRGNWYLAEQLEQQVATVQVCLTDADLATVPFEAQGRTTILGGPRKQAAVRVDDKIYVDQKILMDDESKGVLYTHELGHPLIDPSITDPRTHHEKLRDFVAALYLFEKGKLSLEKLADKLKDASVVTLIDAGKAARWKDDIRIVLDESKPDLERKRAALRAREAAPFIRQVAELVEQAMWLPRWAVQYRKLEEFQKAIDLGVITASTNLAYGEPAIVMAMDGFPEAALLLAKLPDFDVSAHSVTQEYHYRKSDGLREYLGTKNPDGSDKFVHGKSLLDATVYQACSFAGKGNQVAREFLLALLKNPALDVNATDVGNPEMTMAPFLHAVYDCDIEVVRAFLMRMDLEVNSRWKCDLGSETALHIAAFWGKADKVRLLLADPRTDRAARNDRGQTALMIAREMIKIRRDFPEELAGYRETIRVLEEAEGRTGS